MYNNYGSKISPGPQILHKHPSASEIKVKYSIPIFVISHTRFWGL